MSRNLHVTQSTLYLCPSIYLTIHPLPLPLSHTPLCLYRRIPVHGVALVDALRVFLESFRLLGESPVVERILESFSQHWLVSYEGASNSGVRHMHVADHHVVNYMYWWVQDYTFS